MPQSKLYDDGLSKHERHRLKANAEKLKKHSRCFMCDGNGRFCERCFKSNCKCTVGRVYLCGRCKGSGILLLKIDELKRWKEPLKF